MSRSITLDYPGGKPSLRLDVFLADNLEGLSRSQAKRLIESGKVVVQGALCTKPSAKLKGPVSIEVHLPDPEPAEPEPEDIPIDILYQDRHLAVIDKPAGLVVHPGAGNSTGTLVNALLYHMDGLSGIGGTSRPGIVHRLDKDTTGLMVVAKSDAAHMALSQQFSHREVKKSYLAICSGIPQDVSGIVDEPIGRDPWVRTRMAVSHASGRPALSKWRLRRRLFRSSLMEISIMTGRTHQIRVHMRHIGHPLLGDSTYQGPVSITCPGGREIDFHRPLLHSWRLSFSHPADGRPMEFEAEIPEDMKEALSALSSCLDG